VNAGVTDIAGTAAGQAMGFLPVHAFNNIYGTADNNYMFHLDSSGIWRHQTSDSTHNNLLDNFLSNRRQMMLYNGQYTDNGSQVLSHLDLMQEVGNVFGNAAVDWHEGRHGLAVGKYAAWRR